MDRAVRTQDDTRRMNESGFLVDVDTDLLFDLANVQTVGKRVADPLDLISVLRQIEGVSKVEGPKGQGECGPLVHVQLAEDIGVS